MVLRYYRGGRSPLKSSLALGEAGLRRLVITGSRPTGVGAPAVFAGPRPTGVGAPAVVGGPRPTGVGAPAVVGGPRPTGVGAPAVMRARRGLTLIELMVAATMAAILLWAVAGVFRAAVDTRNRLTGRTQELSELRRAHDLIARDFHSCLMPPEDSSILFGLTNQQDQFGAGNLAMASSIGEPLLASRPTSEVVIVRYVLGQDPLDRSGQTGILYRYAVPYPEGTEGATIAGIDAETRQQPLLRNVDSVSYLFYSEERRDWVQTWEQETGLPLAVRMDLAMHRVGEPAGSRTETWIFQLPAAKFINEEEGVEAEGEASGSTTGAGGATGGAR